MRLFFITCLASLDTVGLCQVKTKSTIGASKTMTLFSQVNVVDVETGRVLPDRDVLVGDVHIVSIKKHGNAGISFLSTGLY